MSDRPRSRLSAGREGSGLQRATVVRNVGLWLLLTSLAAVGFAADNDPWSLLVRFRANLEAQSPLTADFVQSYLPEGFSSGESESGTFRLSLPECLRWDYDEPFPKSFILCGDVLHYWNIGETDGHREEIDAETQPGLDLMLLDVESLRARYDAESGNMSKKSAEIVLRPLEPSEYLTEATLTFDGSLRHLLALRYVDEEGNRTTFEISDYRSGVEVATFNPPDDVTWNEF